MKADPLMRWLVDARNQIVKRGDLETRSTARALIRSYGAIALTESRRLTKDLPDRELLEARAHCYGILSVIVAEAHERASFRFIVCDVRTRSSACGD
jgi:hypothetical protein